MAATQQNDVLATNFGSENFPVQWAEGEKELFWIHDDLHIPNPVSPLFFDIGGWWLTCDHMFRRFGTPFACDWVAKNVNGYVYTAAIPCDPALRAEATEYESRYAPRTPRDPEYAGQIGAYLGGVLPIYAANFMQWWKTRLRPEIERNFAYLDGFDYAGASLLELAVLLEDAIDVHDRHWKIHWMLNFAQFASTTNLNAVIEEVGADTALMGRLQSSVQDRNWDAIEDLWKAKEEIKGDAELQAAFEAQTASGVMAALAGSERGRRFVTERIETHQRTFGYKSIWSHELLYKLWVEDPAPIVEAIRGYVATDYDYPTNPRSVHDDLEDAKRAVMEGVEGADREKLAAALQLSLNMNPLTPDHHFYVDQGTNARLRVAAIAIGRKLVEAGALADAEDVVFLHYNELRRLMADPQVFDAQELVSDRRDDREDAFEKRSPSWLGTATQEALDFPYAGLWGFPERFHAGEPSTTGELKGLAASPGIVEGPARFVSSLEEFDQVQQGEILVCRMTNPAWVVLFTKIAGLVTEAGGTVSHPAVVAREFGIPAVVGTGNAGERIKTGDRVRVNGATGVVEILGVTAGTGPTWLAPSSLEEALALRAEHGDEATVLAGGTFLGILMNQGFLNPAVLLSLGRVSGLGAVASADGHLRLGAMATHTAVERSETVRAGWPVLARAFGLVASPRVRNQATVGGVLADADYASDPPSVLAALGARVGLRSARGERTVAIDELILGYYDTCIEPDELLVEVIVPPAPERAVYRKFRSRSSEDRPCVAVAAALDGGRVRVVVGAVAEVPQHFPDVCSLADGQALVPALCAEIGRRYAERVEPLADARGSAAYRRRVIAVEVRRALEDLAA